VVPYARSADRWPDHRSSLRAAAVARILVVRVRRPPPGSGGRGPPESFERADGATRLAHLTDRVLMTAEAHTALQAELEHLQTVKRREIAERIKTAREWGDLKENSEYHDAKNDQAHLETKILRIREQLLAAEVREVETQTHTVGFGSRVEVEDAGSGKKTTYTLVSAPEAAPADGKLSIDSPVGRALVGARVNDTIKLETPRGVRELKVVAIGG
jgi:transcription elongation factor GreA